MTTPGPSRPARYLGDVAAGTQATCWRCLTGATSGWVVLERHGRPVIFPVDHVTDGRTIVFRVGANSVLGTLTPHHPITFEVDDVGATGDARRTITVTGELERIDHGDRARIDPPPPRWAAGRVETWLRIRPGSIGDGGLSARAVPPRGRRGT